MKQVNLKGRFYGTAIRSVLTILVLALFLALVPQVTMLQNQHFTINNNIVTGVEIAKVLISLVIVGVLLYFAYTSETQLPKITKFTKFKWIGLIIASIIHIAVVFIAYSYLMPFAKDRGQINQVFNAVFLLLLCIPIFRCGSALYKTIDIFATGTENVFGKTNESIKCQHCGIENDPMAKFCANCGNILPPPIETPQAVICERCNKENEASAKFCANCGNQLSSASAKHQTVICPQCGAENGGNVKYCIKCGTSLHK